MWCATYVCPILCTLICNSVLLLCGKRYSWMYYITASFLALLLGPDREASVLFVFLGIYPCIRVYMERFHLRIIIKLLYFNIATAVATWISAYVLGLTDLIEEFTFYGNIGLMIIIVLANVTFYLLDLLIFRMNKMHRKKGR